LKRKDLKTLINNMHDRQSGLILFANDENEWFKIRGCMGKLITTLALTNDLIKSLVLRIYQSLP
jgi:hypothetical protein